MSKTKHKKDISMSWKTQSGNFTTNENALI